MTLGQAPFMQAGPTRGKQKAGTAVTLLQRFKILVFRLVWC